MTKINERAMARALFTLREVMHKLRQGVDKTAFEKEYRGKRISPAGISVLEYMHQLRVAGNLEETVETMKLKPARPYGITT